MKNIYIIIALLMMADFSVRAENVMWYNVKNLISYLMVYTIGHLLVIGENLTIFLGL